MLPFHTGKGWPHALPSSSDEVTHLHREADAQPTADQSGTKLQSGLGALDRLAFLEERFRHGVPPSEVPQTDRRPDAEEPKRSRKNVILRRGAKSLIALALVIALGWVPLQRLWLTTSAEATVNARLVNLRAPIDGSVATVDTPITIGTSVNAGQNILHLSNARADRSRLDDLRRTISALQSESAALTQRRDQLGTLKAELSLQKDAFQEGRILQLEARAAEISAQIASAIAQRDEAAFTLERTRTLTAKGHQSEAALQRAERDHTVATKRIEAERKRLEATQVELEAARKGLFVGDSYNDIPRSAQRVDEIKQQIIDVTTQLGERTARLAHLENELKEERQLFAQQESANVAVPVRGRIWEVLTADGEEVRRGQDLLRVLDCAGAVVTAAVSEATYNSLWIGQPATFRLRGESKEHTGSVVGLHGLAAAGASFAINKNALTREPYHVTVAVPDLAASSDCNVGRTGKVTFNTSVMASAPSSSLTR